jgi:hypothetical protein
MRVKKPLAARDKFVKGKPLDAKVFVIHLLVSARGSALYRFPLFIQCKFEIAPDPAIGTNYRNLVRNNFRLIHFSSPGIS